MVVAMAILFAHLDSRGSYRPYLEPASDKLQLGTGPEVRIGRLRVAQPVRIQGRSGLKLVAVVDVVGGSGLRLEYRCRLLLPSGVPVRARASRYRGDGDRFQAMALTPDLRFPEAHFDDLWIFLPYGAIDLPGGVHDLLFRLTVSLDGRPLATSELRADVVLPGVEQEPPAALEGLETLELVAATELASCPVCGEEVRGTAYLCPRCGAPHHRDCWDYAEGCAVYACGEGVREAPGSPPRSG